MVSPNDKRILGPLRPVSQFVVSNVLIAFCRQETVGKNSIGVKLVCWMERPPTPESEASTSTINRLLGLAWVRTGAEMNRDFSTENALSASEDQQNGTLIEVSLVRGEATLL